MGHVVDRCRPGREGWGTPWRRHDAHLPDTLNKRTHENFPNRSAPRYSRGTHTIDSLLAPKVLTEATRYTAEGTTPAESFEDDDNLILRGNNLVVLASIAERYAGQVKLIYIDPPFGTGSDGFEYNDRFALSSWLTFMKNRLEFAQRLLSDDPACPTS